MLEDV